MSIGDLVTRLYGNFRGADFRGDEINMVRSPDCLNVWKDYRETDSIRTRPGMRFKYEMHAPVYGIFFYRDKRIVHAGSKLYAQGVSAADSFLLYSGLNENVSDGFFYGDVFYFKDGKHYLKVETVSVSPNGNTTYKATEVVGYVPTTSIGRKPAGGGTIHEDVNMLTSKRKNTFLADGKSVEFYLDAKNIDSDFVPVVKVNDAQVTNFTVDYAKGMVKFTTAPSAPKTDGQDNVSIEFKKDTQDRNKILGCTLLQVFDNRVFFSGNKDYPNTVWHCSLNDPSYVSDLDYYREGLDNADIISMVAGNNALWVFREPNESNTNVFYHTPALDDEYGKIYPSVHSSVSIGCVAKAINFNDDIVFFSTRGMEGISGDVTTEQMAAHRSTLVDRKLLSEKDYKNMILTEWEGYLLVIIGDKVYLADSRGTFANEGHTEYEWFYWEMEKKITAAKVFQGVLYLGTEDGIYTLTDNEKALESYWVTPKDKFKHPHMQKTTNKRGCVAEATGDVSVYVKTDKTDFQLVGTYENVTDSFVSRIKRKKWKDIQLKFYSNKRFSLEQVTLEAYVGGYIKR